MDEDLKAKSGATNPAAIAALGNDPHNWWLLRSTLDITERHEFDVTARRVGELPNPAVPAYTAVDARLGWRARPGLDVSLSALNLFDPAHAEWGVPTNRAEYGRTVFLGVTWQH